MSYPLPRVVYDCQVFLQAVLNDQGPAARCVQLAEEGFVQLCVSAEILEEVADVLTRPELQRRFSRLTPALADGFLGRVCEFAVVVAEVPWVFHYDRDPEDEPYINLALAAGASYLVSRDRDLLDLQPATSPEGQALRALAPQLAILDPVAFLQTVAH